MKKIKSDGHYGGKNVFDIDEEGKFKSHDDRKMKDLDENLKNALSQQTDYVPLYSMKLEENKELDKMVATQKLKQTKEKQKLSKRDHLETKRGNFKG